MNDTPPERVRRCECPCNEPLPRDAPENQRWRNDRCKMRGHRAERAADRKQSAALWGRIRLGGASLAERRGRRTTARNGVRPALTQTPERVHLTT